MMLYRKSLKFGVEGPIDVPRGGGGGGDPTPTPAPKAGKAATDGAGTETGYTGDVVAGAPVPEAAESAPATEVADDFIEESVDDTLDAADGTDGYSDEAESLVSVIQPAAIDKEVEEVTGAAEGAMTVSEAQAQAYKRDRVEVHDEKVDAVWIPEADTPGRDGSLGYDRTRKYDFTGTQLEGVVVFDPNGGGKIVMADGSTRELTEADVTAFLKGCPGLDFESMPEAQQKAVLDFVATKGDPLTQMNYIYTKLQPTGYQSSYPAGFPGDPKVYLSSRLTGTAAEKKAAREAWEAYVADAEGNPDKMRVAWNIATSGLTDAQDLTDLIEQEENGAQSPEAVIAREAAHILDPEQRGMVLDAAEQQAEASAEFEEYLRDNPDAARVLAVEAAREEVKDKTKTKRDDASAVKAWREYEETKPDTGELERKAEAELEGGEDYPDETAPQEVKDYRAAKEESALADEKLEEAQAVTDEQAAALQLEEAKQAEYQRLVDDVQTASTPEAREAALKRLREYGDNTANVPAEKKAAHEAVVARLDKDEKDLWDAAREKEKIEGEKKAAAKKKLEADETSAASQLKAAADKRQSEKPGMALPAEYAREDGESDADYIARLKENETRLEEEIAALEGIGQELEAIAGTPEYAKAKAEVETKRKAAEEAQRNLADLASALDEKRLEEASRKVKAITGEDPHLKRKDFDQKGREDVDAEREARRDRTTKKREFWTNTLTEPPKQAFEMFKTGWDFATGVIDRGQQRAKDLTAWGEKAMDKAGKRRDNLFEQLDKFRFKPSDKASAGAEALKELAKKTRADRLKDSRVATFGYTKTWAEEDENEAKAEKMEWDAQIAENRYNKGIPA